MDILELKRIALKAREDPVWWMTTLMGWTLWDKQAEIAAALKMHERVAVPASFACGKTFLAARLALDFLYNNKPCRVITTAPGERQVKNLLWAELRTAHAEARFPLGGVPSTLHLELGPNQFATGFATKNNSVDYFTGYHAPNQLVIFDQASGINRSIWEGAEGLMTSQNCHWLAISNTVDAESEFAKIVGGSKRYGKWKLIPITAWDVPNVKEQREVYPGLTTYKWVMDRLEAWGEDDPLYRIFIMAEFVESSRMVVVRSRLWHPASPYLRRPWGRSLLQLRSHSSLCSLRCA